MIKTKQEEDTVKPDNLYNDLYNSLKLDFAKSKEHFMKKMSEY